MWFWELTWWFSAQDEVGSFTGFTVASGIHCSHAELVVATFHQVGNLQSSVIHHVVSVDSCPTQALLLAFVYEVVADLIASVRFWFCPLNDDMLLASPDFFRYARLWRNSCLYFMKIRMIRIMQNHLWCHNPTFQWWSCLKVSLLTEWVSGYNRLWFNRHTWAVFVYCPHSEYVFIVLDQSGNDIGEGWAFAFNNHPVEPAGLTSFHNVVSYFCSSIFLRKAPG